MKYRYLILIVMFVAGCMYPGIKTKTDRVLPDGTTEQTVTTLHAPRYALEGSSVADGREGVQATLGASQKAKDIAAATGDAVSKKIVYGALAIIIILGAVALALPNTMVSNKDALIMIGCGGIGFALFRFVEAAAPAMGIIIPIMALAGGVYLFWQWRTGAAEPARYKR